MVQRIHRFLERKTNFFLYFSACILNLTSFTGGVSWAWSSPVTPKLQGNVDNPLGVALTDDEVSWIASLLPLGSTLGPFVGGYLADKIGRKWTLVFSMIPAIASFLTLAFVHNMYLYYVARFVLGLTALGVPMAVVPMYIGEVAEIHNRGTLGCFTILYCAIGTVFSFSIGPHVAMKWFNLSCIIAPTVFLVVFTFLVPETPAYLIMTGKDDEARMSLKKFRHSTANDEISKEFEDIKAMVEESIASKGGITDILKTKHLRKGLCLTMGLMVVQQFTATSIITFYLQFIFESAGSSIAPEIAPIIIGGLEVFGAIASALLVDRFGRKPLLIASTLATWLSLLVLSIYFYLLTVIDVSSFAWLPLLTLIVYNLSYGIGIGSLPQTVLSEIFPPHVKSIASSLTVCCCNVFSFVTSKIFFLLVSAMGNWFAFSVFTIANACGVVFIWATLPETKKKTLNEILESLK